VGDPPPQSDKLQARLSEACRACSILSAPPSGAASGAKRRSLKFFSEGRDAERPPHGRCRYAVDADGLLSVAMLMSECAIAPEAEICMQAGPIGKEGSGRRARL
jgi:hypothetical protein